MKDSLLHWHSITGIPDAYLADCKVLLLILSDNSAILWFEPSISNNYLLALLCLKSTFQQELQK